MKLEYLKNAGLIILMITIVSPLFCSQDSLFVNLVGDADELFDEGSYDLSIEKYEKALEIDPEDAEALRKLGHVYQAKGDYKKALEYYDYSSFINRDNVLLWINTAQSYFANGDYKEAKETIEKASELAAYDVHKQMIDSLRVSLEFIDSSLAHIIVLDKDEARKFNENDRMLFAFVSDFLTGEMQDTVIAFYRGEDLDEHFYIGLAHFGKRHYKETLPKIDFQEFTRFYSKGNKLKKYYVNPKGNFLMEFEIEKIIRKNNEQTGMLEYEYDYSYIDVEINKKWVCFDKIKNGLHKEPECFEFGIYKGDANSPVAE